MEPPDPPAQVVLVVRGREVPLGALDAAPAGLGLLDEVLQLGLAAGRVGAAIRLTHVRRDLRELVDLAGLADRLGLGPPP